MLIRAQIHLFYVNTSNCIAVLKGPGYWSNITMQYDSNDNHPGLLPLAPNLKSLAAYRYSKNNQSGLTALLLYETVNGSVKLSYGQYIEAVDPAFQGCANGCTLVPRHWQWHADNSSNPFFSSLDFLSAPFGLYPGFYRESDTAVVFVYNKSSKFPTSFPFYELAFGDDTWFPGWFDPDCKLEPCKISFFGHLLTLLKLLMAHNHRSTQKRSP